MQTVAIVDYGMGNLDSVARAVEECGGKPRITADPSELGSAAAVILPGVGAFASGMANLRERGLADALKLDVVDRKVPLLGVCLGMQLLADLGTEVKEAPGLGFVPGEVVRLQAARGLRVPHVGWNDAQVDRDSPLFENIGNGQDFYFVHSYHFVCRDEQNVIARVQYGAAIVVAVQRGLVFGVQFHPEKSQNVGFQLLCNFLEISRVGSTRAAHLEPIGH